MNVRVPLEAIRKLRGESGVEFLPASAIDAAVSRFSQSKFQVRDDFDYVI